MLFRSRNRIIGGVLTGDASTVSIPGACRSPIQYPSTAGVRFVFGGSSRMSVENGAEFFRAIVGNEMRLDVGLAARDILDAGKALVAQHKDVGAIVLECTNMPPYAAALREAVGLPVYDIYSMINWFHAGLRPRRFDLTEIA